jgi:hypothetical protein
MSPGAVDMVWWLSLETQGPAFSSTVQAEKLYIVVVFVKAAWQKKPVQLSGLRRTEWYGMVWLARHRLFKRKTTAPRRQVLF